MSRRPTKEDLTRRIWELEEENLQLRKAADEHQEKHRRVLESIEEGYYELDLDGNIVSFNQVAGTLLGYAPHEVRGRSYREYTSPGTARRMYEIFHRIYKTGDPERLVNYEVICRDGSVRTHEMSAGLMRDTEGNPKGFHVLVHDVTTRRKAEVLLRESEERYRTIFENTGNATIVIAEDTTILLANSNFESLTGYTKDEMEGKMSWTVFIVPEDLERMKRYHAQRRQEGEGAPPSYEFRLMTRSGDLRDIFLTVALIPGTSESVASCMDITKRKQAEEALRASEERYRGILDSIDDAYFELDLKGSYTFANTAVHKMLGYDHDEIIGLNYRSYLSPETAQRMQDVFGRIYRTGNPVHLVDYEVIRKDGSFRTHEMNVAPMRDASGDIVGFRGVGRDVTERKKAEDALRLSEERYRSILESMEEAYYEVDLRGNFTFFNSKAVNRLGYSVEELSGMNYHQYMDEESSRKVFKTFNKVFMTGEPVTGFAWELKNKQGESIFVEASISLRRNAEGNPLGFFGVVRDITDRKRAEEALRASEEKYRGILESMQEAYFEVDLRGNFTFFNNTAVLMSGYSREELMGMNYRQYTPSKTARRLLEVFHRVYKTGNPELIVDYEVIHKDGVLRDNEMSVWPMRDASGAIVGFHSLVRDVTERKRTERAIKQSEERYRTIFENTGGATVLIGQDTTILLANSNLEKLSGYSKEEIEGRMSWTEFVAEGDLERMMRYHEQRRIDAASAPQSYEFHMKHRSGKVLDAFITIVMMPGTKESVASIIDITERKKAEEALRQSEERWQFALEGAGDGLWDYDVEHGKIFRSKRWKDMLGYTEDDISESPDEWSRLVHPDDRQPADHDLERHLRGETPVYIHEHRIRCKDGSYKWILDRGKVIAWSKDERPLRIIGTQTDITERKQAEAALRQSEERYRTILETMDEAYFELDLQGNYTYVNDAQCRVMGYTREELLGMNNREYTSPETAKRAYKTFSEILRTGTPGTMTEYEVLRKDGRKIISEFSASIMRGASGEPVGFRGVGRDVTERIRAEKALKESERKYRLLAENLRDVIWVLDADLKYVYVSPSVMQLRGYTPEEAMRQTMDQVLAPESYRKAIEVFAQERIHEFSGQKHGKNWTMNLDLEMIRKDGSTVWTEVTLNILYDEHGEPEGLLGITHDISDRRKAEEAIRESEERYRTLFDGMMDGAYRSTHEGRFLDINQAMVDMFGYESKEEMMQVDIKKELYFLPEDRDIQSIKDRHTGEEIHCMRRRDGSAIWVEDHARYVYDEHGNILLHEGTLRDVTERKRAEEALKQSEERYRTIFESTATANIIVAEDTTILLANSNFERLTGYSRKELEGKMSWTSFVMEDDLDMMKQRHFQRRTDPGSVLNAYEFRARVRSGEVRNLYMSVSMIPETRDSVASLIDMTDRRKAEDGLRQSEERFRDLARLLPETVFETDSQGELTFVNEISLERFGFTREDVGRGINILDVIAPQDHERAIMNYQRVMQGERLGLSEYTARRKDGTTFPALIHSTPIYREGREAGLRGFLIDVTEKKSLEEQLMRAQKLEAIGTLAGGIAHDFNNLLMGILGNISLMLMHIEESHPFHDRLKSMEEYVQRGSDLTKQLLGFARGGKYEVKSTHLGEFVRRSAEMFGRTKKEIRIHHKTSDGLWTVEVDRGQMEQVMLNLFVNAWQAMPGGGDLYLSVENADLVAEDVSPYDIKPGRFVKLTVTDTGVGMDAATKARIFEPFFSTKERSRGTGLGLASVYGIVKNHGGFILVESEKDIGTSFTVYLPASDKGIEDENHAPGKVHKGKETVLIIDDEEMIVDVGKSMLEGLGYRVLTARGGRQGLQLFDQNRRDIDLVILDMIMPDFGGKETFEALRRQDPQVKVLLSSGYSLDGQAKEILEEGCRGFIQKPFTMAELSKKIREILEES